MLYFSLFAAGLLLSMHCVGMCGGFVALLTTSTTPGAVGRAAESGASRSPTAGTGMLLRPHLLFHMGRIASYAALGAAAGAFGSFSALFRHAGRPQSLLMLAAGGVMAAAGLAILGLLRWNLMRPAALLPADWLRAALRAVLRWPKAVLAIPYGALLGLLPCGLIYTMLIRAAASASALGGAAVMASFGAGTIPALLLVGYGARFFTPARRQRLFAISGALLVLLGIMALWQGLQWTRWLG